MPLFLNIVHSVFRSARLSFTLIMQIHIIDKYATIIALLGITQCVLFMIVDVGTIGIGIFAGHQQHRNNEFHHKRPWFITEQPDADLSRILGESISPATQLSSAIRTVHQEPTARHQ